MNTNKIHKTALTALDSIQKISASLGSSEAEKHSEILQSRMNDLKLLVDRMQMVPGSIRVPPELEKPEIEAGGISTGSIISAINSLNKHLKNAQSSFSQARENMNSEVYHALALHHMENTKKSLTLVCDLSRTMHSALKMPLDHINTPPELDHPSITGYGDHPSKSRDYFGRRKF